MSDVGTTTGEQVCEVRVTGADAARVPRVLAAAERYREAWAADRAAASAYAVAHFAWRVAGMPCEGPEHAALKPVRDACDRTEREHEAACDALLAAARGAP